jgi:hypothetical protein
MPQSVAYTNAKHISSVVFSPNVTVFDVGLFHVQLNVTWSVPPVCTKGTSLKK